MQYRRLWPQLWVVDGTLYKHFAPGPTSDPVTVPIFPVSLQKQALPQNHDAPSSGHQGPDYTLERLCQEAYWITMAGDVEQHCRKWPHANKPSHWHHNVFLSQTMENDCGGCSWGQQNPLGTIRRYLLEVQDYFTKRADAVPLQDQMANRITEELVKVSVTHGQPEILHSDQNQNAELHCVRP